MVADFFLRKGKLKYYGIGRIYYHMHVIAVTNQILELFALNAKKKKLIIIHNKV